MSFELKHIAKARLPIIIGSLISLGVIFYTAFTGSPNRPSKENDAAVVSLISSDVIAVKTGSRLEKKFNVFTVQSQQVNTPLLVVTGAIVARLPKGNGPKEDLWQFNSLDLSSVYADWLRASAEKDFNQKRLVKIRELTAAQYHSQKIVVDRLRKLVATGTEAIRDLTSAEASLLEIQLEGQKDVYEAETALSVATRTRAALERQLYQEGVDPQLLEQSNPGISLIMADVPELKISQVSVGQSCTARFYGLSNQVFSGKVRSLAPSLSQERHTLRVFFELNDLNDQFKPGMYAEIGLGTDLRPVVMIPTDSVLHSQNSDYILVNDGIGRWRINAVQVSESIDNRIEILRGLHAGEKIIGSGAILLKPMLVQALQIQASISESK